jgi:hypothetical protein
MTPNRAIFTALLAMAAAACAPEAKLRWDTRTTPVVVAGAPTLVAIGPDVWVVRDADHPVYYVEGAYWAVHEKRCYRSFDYETGFSPVDEDAVPRAIVDLNHAYYTQYHGEATALTRRPPVSARHAASSTPGGRRHE